VARQEPVYTHGILKTRSQRRPSFFSPAPARISSRSQTRRATPKQIDRPMGTRKSPHKFKSISVIKNTRNTQKTPESRLLAPDCKAASLHPRNLRISFQRFCQTQDCYNSRTPLYDSFTEASRETMTMAALARVPLHPCSGELAFAAFLSSDLIIGSRSRSRFAWLLKLIFLSFNR